MPPLQPSQPHRAIYFIWNRPPKESVTTNLSRLEGGHRSLLFHPMEKGGTIPTVEMMLLAFEMNLLGGGLDFCAVVETDVPVAAALRGKVHAVPDGSQQVDAALGDVGRHSRMREVEVAQSAVGIAREHGNGGILMPLAVFGCRCRSGGAACPSRARDTFGFNHLRTL